MKNGSFLSFDKWKARKKLWTSLGPAGDKGETGLTGPPGPQGDKGARGKQGKRVRASARSSKRRRIKFMKNTQKKTSLVHDPNIIPSTPQCQWKISCQVI